MSGNPPHLSEHNPIRVNQAIRDLYEGRSNAVGSVTLTANDTTTVVSAINCGSDSSVFMFPLTANAGAALASGGVYISSVGAETFTITHPSSADVDQTFNWVALG